MIKLNPNYQEAYCEKGITLTQLGKLEEAILCFDEAIHINQKCEYVYFHKGTLLMLLNK